MLSLRKRILNNLQPGGIFMENEKKPKKRVRTTSVITLLMCLIDIYIIINIPEDYTILAVSTLITLVCSILTLNSWFKWKDLEEQNRREQYSDIMNVQKSSYVIIQKKVQDLDEKLNFIGQKIMPLEKAGDVNQKKIATMLDSIVEDQKKIAKITISRSKENADALMNSNDKLLLQMEEFRNSIAGMQEQLLTQQGEIRDEEARKLDNSTDEIFKRITELKDLLEKEADEISENILTSKQSLEESYNSAIEAAESKIMTSETGSMTDRTSSEETNGTDQAEEYLPSAEEEPAEEPAMESQEAEEKQAEEPAITDQEAEEKQAEEPAITNQEAEEEQAEEPAITNQVEETAIDSQQAAEAQLMSEPIAEEEQASAVDELPVPEPIVVEEQPAVSQASDSSMPDPNSAMSPEDIAALIAKTESEDLPETTEKYEEEEKPPMPDMSDPNRPMSPEDIAALIANM